jgi:FSR family fosmidomycin resistance protein-like MFS transporter
MIKQFRRPLIARENNLGGFLDPLSLIEFFDELNYAIEGAVLPVMRVELALSYAQVGLLLGIPHVIGTLIEPVIMLLGDTNLRKWLILAGGLGVVTAMFLIATAAGFPMLLLAMVISYPASGAFVTLSQATLMDLNPGREPQMMARWTVAGSLGNLIGPLFVAAGFTLALGWRWIFIVLAILALLLTLVVLFRHFPDQTSTAYPPGVDGIGTSQRLLVMRTVFANLREAVRNAELLRWTVLLQFSDLLLDVFIGFAPLFLTDVIGVTSIQASLLLSVLMLSSLAADVALIPILERYPGRTVVRTSAAVTIVLCVAAAVPGHSLRSA